MTKEQRTGKFGWCMTGVHSLCPASFTDWNSKTVGCSCSCHGEKRTS